VVTRFSADDAFDNNLRIVAERLESAGVQYAVVSAAPGRHRAIMVPSEDRSRALTALADGNDGRAIYGAEVSGDGRLGSPRSVDTVRGSIGFSRSDVVRIFEVLAVPGGTGLAGPDYVCDVEFWRRRGAVLASPRPNRRAVELPAGEPASAQLILSPRHYPTYPPVLAPNALDVSFPVDVVYTWVDGSDPDWLARKRAAWSHVDAGSLSELAANASRYLSRDELRYSLRSLEMYASWVRKIYIVTDDQVPPWLNRDHPKISLVSHREIFNWPDALPTFNSHAIEANLHHIEGLSEHYLYLNDDVFFGRPVSPEMFFLGNGLSKFFLSRKHMPLGPTSPDEPPVDTAAKNNRELLVATFGSSVTQKFKHAPHPQQRSVLMEMEKVFGEQFERTSRSRFRHPDDLSVASALHHYYAWFTGRGVPADIRYYYADIGAPETASRLRRILRERDYDSFCLNDPDSAYVDAVEQARIIREFLEAYYPLPSSFEIA
jgi:hypothetical protein